MHNELCERLGIEFPIFAFSHCRDVVAAVTNAGGIGVLGALAFSPEQLELELKWIDEHVNGKPYGVDVVIPASHVGAGFEDVGALLPKLQEMVPQETMEWIDGVLDELGVPAASRRGECRRPASVDDGGGLGGSGLLGWTNATSKPQVEVALASRHRAARQRARAAAEGRRRRRPRARCHGRRARRPARPGAQAGRAGRRHRDRAGHRSGRPHR